MTQADVLTRVDIPRLHAHGATLPAIGFGTVDLNGDAGAEVVATALRVGHRHIDAARKYWTEKEVGEGIRASGVARSEIFLTTKVSHENLHADDFRRSAEDSLKDLGLDYVDLLLVHWPNPKIPLTETMKALAKCKRDGLTRHVGVANFTTPLLDEAVQLSPEPLVCNQVEFQPYLDQRKVLAACRKHGMVLIGYCPLMRGGAVLHDPVVGEIARVRGKTPAQIALRWSVQHGDVAPIPRSRNAQRLHENLQVFDFELTADEMARVSALRSANKRVANRTPFAGLGCGVAQRPLSPLVPAQAGPSASRGGIARVNSLDSRFRGNERSVRERDETCSKLSDYTTLRARKPAISWSL